MRTPGRGVAAHFLHARIATHTKNTMVPATKIPSASFSIPGTTRYRPVPVPVGLSVRVAGGAGLGSGPGIAESSGRGCFDAGASAGVVEGVADGADRSVRDSPHPVMTAVSRASGANGASAARPCRVSPTVCSGSALMAAPPSSDEGYEAPEHVVEEVAEQDQEIQHGEGGEDADGRHRASPGPRPPQYLKR